MNIKSIVKKPIIVVVVICILVLPGCLSKRYITFKGVGFLDVNGNGIRDDGEERVPNFRVTVKLYGQKNGQKVGPFDSAYDLANNNGKYELMSTEDDEYDADELYHQVSVTDIPAGYVLGAFQKTHSIPEETDPEYGCRKREFSVSLDIPFLIDEDYIPPITQTPTPTFTPTNTPTDTPIPTSTYTPTPTITANLTGYGSYGGGVDFVKFILSYAPASGTFSADVGGNTYTCSSSTSDPTILTCQGPAFPSGIYVDVVLYFNGTVIFSGQIFRAIEEPDKKPTPTVEVG